MNALLAELGRQLTGRVAAMLLGPGALYVVAAVLAGVLGQAHALDHAAAQSWLHARATGPDSVTAVLLVAAGFLAASAAAGLVAAALGMLVRRSWSASGPRWLSAARGARWARADRIVARLTAELARDPAAPDVRAQLSKAIAARDRIALAPPMSATWVGDRLLATEARVRRAYGLDLAAAWPRLWLVLPDAARAEVAAARQRCTAAALLAGWAVLYLPMAAWWWPAAVAAVMLGAVAAVQIRQAVVVYAELAEAAVDLYGRDLLARIGLDVAARLTPAAGAEANSLLRKDLTDRL